MHVCMHIVNFTIKPTYTHKVSLRVTKFCMLTSVGEGRFNSVMHVHYPKAVPSQYLHIFGSPTYAHTVEHSKQILDDDPTRWENFYRVNHTPSLAKDFCDTNANMQSAYSS